MEIGLKGGLAIVCFIVGLIVLILWYGNFTCPGFGRSCPVAAVALTSLQSLLATGQALQTSPLEIGSVSSPVTFTTAPTGFITQPSPSFTWTMDVSVSQTATGLRNLLYNGTATSMTPGVFITGTDEKPPNRIRVSMGAASSKSTAALSVVATCVNAVPLSTFVTITFTVDSGNTNIYINGILDPSGTASGTSVPWVNGPWTWNQTQFMSKNNDSIKVTNAYFWPSLLLPTQISLLGTSSSTPPPPTTSSSK